MANVIGQLRVILALDAAEFTSGLEKADRDAKKFARNLESGIATGARLAAAGMAVAAGAALVMAKNIIADAAALDDLSDATGSSVENLSRLSNQAKISGTDFGTLQGLVLKLTAGMAGADDESSNVGRALKFLGVTAKDPAEALQQVAVALDKYADGTGKAALARDLFGKGGPAFLATLKDIAKLQDVAATTTTKQAQEAEKLEQAYRRLTAEGTIFKNFVLSGIVPALNNLIDRFKLAREAGEGIFGAFQRAGTNTENITQQLEEQEKIVERVRKGVEAGRGSNNPLRLLPGLFVTEEDLKKEEAKLRALRAIHQQFLGLTEPARIAGTEKPRAAYTGAKDDKSPKAGADEFARALESVQKAAAAANVELSAAFSGEKILGAQRALAALMADDSWKTFTDAQRQRLTIAYQQVIATEKETEAWRKEREEREKAIKVEQDIEKERQKASETATKALGDFAEQNKILERQLAIVGAEDVVHQRLAATMEYEKALALARVTGEQTTIDALNEQLQIRLKLIDSFDAANKKLEEQRKTKEFIRSLGDAFGQAAEDAIVFGRTAKDVLKSLKQDLLRLITRRLVTEPLSNAISGIIGGFFGGGMGGPLGALSGGAPAFASGTNYAPGGFAWVGEHGKELVNLPRGSQVIPNHEVKRIENSYAPTINVTVMPGATKQSAAQVADEMTRRQLQASRNR